MSGRLVMGELRVQEVRCGDGRRAVTILNSDGSVHAAAEAFLCDCAGGTDRTYAYLLVDHLRCKHSRHSQWVAVCSRDVVDGRVLRHAG